MAARFAVSQEALDAALLRSALPSFGGQATGAVITFEGLVRATNQGRQVLRLVYEGYEPMIVRVFEQIAREIDDAWPGTACAIHHRLGTLQIGDVSIVIATASAHRAAAYAASRYAIERVKQIAPIWKHEHFEGGQVWIEGAVAGADDDEARKKAMAAACA
ncbi:MAG TPA: molybdenum cofactor biosynthesis protein MoaE [Vicinamibacterales bacterium]|nr:molybdenum cofactor biosynthesis protein MoaE [Vicinamibacterales bacterium]